MLAPVNYFTQTPLTAMITRFCTTLFVLVLALAPAHAQDCEVDVRSGENVVTCNTDVSIEQHGGSWIYESSVSLFALEDNSTLGIIINTTSDSPNFLEETEARVSIDGENASFDLKRIDRNNRILGNGRAAEQFYFILPYQLLKRAAFGRKVYFRVGPTLFKIFLPKFVTN